MEHNKCRSPNQYLLMFLSVIDGLDSCVTLESFLSSLSLWLPPPVQKEEITLHVLFPSAFFTESLSRANEVINVKVSSQLYG
jgi:hypothetical protein